MSLKNQNQPTVSKPSDDKSRFQNYGVRERSEKRREFHSPEAQRERNKQRSDQRAKDKQAAQLPGVYDTSLRRTNSYGSENEDVDSNSGNDEPVKLGQEGGGGGSGGGGTFTLDVVLDDNTAGTATFNGTGVN